MIIPNIWEDKKCSKPPTAYDGYMMALWRFSKVTGPLPSVEVQTAVFDDFPSLVMLHGFDAWTVENSRDTSNNICDLLRD